MKPLGPCSKCGRDEGYFHRLPVRGVWAEFVLPDGGFDNTDLSDVIYGPEPKTVTCAACGARQPNPNLDPAECGASPAERPRRRA